MKPKHKHIPDKIYDIMISDQNFINTYKHFTNRCKERYLPELGEISLATYWLEWILVNRGNLLSNVDKKMIRILGNYHKDEILYKIIYIYNKALDMHIPLTIFGIDDHKRKFRIQQTLLRKK